MSPRFPIQEATSESEVTRSVASASWSCAALVKIPKWESERNERRTMIWSSSTRVPPERAT